MTFQVKAIASAFTPIPPTLRTKIRQATVCVTLMRPLRPVVWHGDLDHGP